MTIIKILTVRNFFYISNNMLKKRILSMLSLFPTIGGTIIFKLQYFNRLIHMVPHERLM